MDDTENSPSESPIRPATVSEETPANEDQHQQAIPGSFLATSESDSAPSYAESAISHSSFSSTVPIQETGSYILDSEKHEFALKSPLQQAFDRQCTMRKKDPIIATKVDQTMRESADDLEEDFACLILEVVEALDSKGVAASSLRTYIINRPSVYGKRKVSLFCKEAKEELLKCTSIDSVFAVLTLNRAWDFLNWRLLYLIKKKFDLTTTFQEYVTKLDSFKQRTKLREFLDIWSMNDEVPDDHDCQPLKSKLKGSWENYTLADLDRDQGFLANAFLLYDYVFSFKDAGEGCVVLVWYIPNGLAEYMKSICKERKPDLAQANFVQLAVGDEIIFQALDVNEPVSRMITHYDEYYKYSIEHPKEFWGEMAARTLVWDEPFDRDKVMEGCDMNEGKISFFDGKLNASVNCLDRHVAAHPNKVAIIWEKNVTDKQKPMEERFTYEQLFEMTCRIANVLKRHKVEKGDKVVIYMPAMPLAVAAMLACTRIGAIHSVVFAVLRVEDLKQRMVDSGASVIITANEAVIGIKTHSLKINVNKAIESCEKSEQQKHIGYTVLVANRTPSESKDLAMVPGRDFWLEKEMENVSSECPPESLDGEHPLFIMYTSGTSNNRLGIVHSTAGYLLQAALTQKYVFDYKPGDVFGCVADLGWITGHSYVVYGSLCNGATSVLFEGSPHYPTYDRYWEMIDRLGVTQFYTTPSTIRYLMKDPDKLINNYSDKLKSLRTIASVGEPLNNNACEWYCKNVGHGRCTLVDTWWQTETGSVSIVINHNLDSKSKSAFPAKPFFGVEPLIIDPITGEEIVETGSQELGYLCLKNPLPSMGRSSFPSEEEYRKNFQTEFTTEKVSVAGLYFTYDKAFHVKGGGYKILARKEDAIRLQNVWLDIPEIESLMNSCDDRIQETSLVRISSSATGTPAAVVGTCAFIELKPNINSEKHPELIDKLKESTSDLNVPNASPKMFIFVSEQLVTHSGKIARSLMREIIDLTQKISLICSTRKPTSQMMISGQNYTETKGFPYDSLIVSIWYQADSWQRSV